MKVAVGGDHAAVEMKAAVVAHLRERGALALDLGTHAPDVSVDYPDYGAAVARKVARGEADLGVVICGTGIGIAMAANKIPGVRAAVVHDEFTARLAREHNHANVLALGARLLAVSAAIRLVDAWMDATPEARHRPRIDKLHALEQPAR